MWITVIGIIVSAIMSVLLSDKIISALQFVLTKFGIKRDVTLAGVWIATFSMGDNTYTEVIRICQKFKRVTGKILYDNRNYERLHK